MRWSILLCSVLALAASDPPPDLCHICTCTPYNAELYIESTPANVPKNSSKEYAENTTAKYTNGTEGNPYGNTMAIHSGNTTVGSFEYASSGNTTINIPGSSTLYSNVNRTENIPSKVNLKTTNLTKRAKSVVPTISDEIGPVNVSCTRMTINELPESMRMPRAIDQLDLSHNNLISASVTAGGPRVVIRQLFLQGNSIERIVEPDFYHLSGLEVLDLSSNQLKEIIGHPFRSLKDLWKLDLSGNILREIPDNAFRYTTELRELSLSGNPLHTLEQNKVSRMPSLLQLDLSRTALTDILHDAFKGCDNLQSLDLSWNNFDEVPTKAFEEIDHLEHLVLTGNPLSILDERSFWFPTNLLKVEVNQMPSLREVQPQTFSRQKSLARVSISNNRMLTKVDAKAFEGSSSLVTIDLSGNQLETISNGDELVAWCLDSELNLIGNPWNCDCKLRWMLHCSGYSSNKSSVPTCSRPESSKGFQIRLMTQDQLVCENDEGGLWSEAHIEKELGIALMCFGVLGVLLSMCGVVLMVKFRPRIRWNRRVKDKNGDVFYLRMEEQDSVEKEPRRH